MRIKWEGGDHNLLRQYVNCISEIDFFKNYSTSNDVRLSMPFETLEIKQDISINM